MSETLKKLEECNIRNGVKGLNKHCCLILTKYFKDDNDIIEVFLFYNIDLFIFKYFKSLDVVIKQFLNGCTKIFSFYSNEIVLNFIFNILMLLFM
jgi:hypothetical protein